VNNLLEAALKYARAGLAVLPIHYRRDGACSCHLGSACEQPFKHPALRDGLKSATTDEGALTEFWEKYPDANVAVVVPKGFAVIDIDPRNGGDVVWDTLEREYGELNTLAAESGGNGLHLWVKTDNVLESPGLGVDVKQQGTGYVIVEPSVHASGRKYTWAEDFDLSKVVEAPPWLASKAPRVARENNELNTISIPDTTVAEVAKLLAPRWTDGRQEWALPFFGYLVTCGWDTETRFCLIDALGGDKKDKYEDIAIRAQSMDGPGHVVSSWPEWPQLNAAIRKPFDQFVKDSFIEAIPEIAKPVPGFSVFGSTTPRAVEFVVKELELGGDVRPGLLTGLPNGGKTPLCLHLALCVAFNRPFLGYMPSKTGNVLLVFFEGSQNLVLLRMLRLARGLGITDEELGAAYKDGRLTLLYSDGGPITGEREAEALVALCQEKKFALGIVDTLTSALDPEIDIHTIQARGPLNLLAKITEKTGTPFVMTAHTPKTGDAVFKTLGSTAIAGAADTIHALERCADKTQFQLTHERAVVNAAAPIFFQFEDGPEPDMEIGASYSLTLRIVDRKESQELTTEKAVEEARKKRNIKDAVKLDAENELIATVAERVIAIADVPRSHKDITTMLNVAPKVARAITERLLFAKRLEYYDGKFVKPGYYEKPDDDPLLPGG
jgi:hypothetical protein